MGIIVVPRGGFDVPDSIARHEPEANTVALWQLNGDLADEGPNGIGLVEVGTVPYVPVGALGKLTSRAAKTTETNHGTTDNLLLNIHGDLTIMNMVRMDPNTADLQHMTFWGQGGVDSDPANNFAYRWAINTGRTLGYLAEHSGGVNVSFNGSTVLNREQWYHVALTRNGSTGLCKIFVDGVVDGSATLTLPTGGENGELRIGDGLNANDDLDGDIGSLHILDRVLSEAEILAEATRLLADWQEMLQ